MSERRWEAWNKLTSKSVQHFFWRVQAWWESGSHWDAILDRDRQRCWAASQLQSDFPTLDHFMASQAQYKFIYKNDVLMKVAMRVLKENQGWDLGGQIASEKMLKLMKARSPMEQEIMLSFSPMVTLKYVCECKVQAGNRRGILLSCISHVIGSFFLDLCRLCFYHLSCSTTIVSAPIWSCLWLKFVPVRQERARTLVDCPRGLQGGGDGELDTAWWREEARGAFCREVPSAARLLKANGLLFAWSVCFFWRETIQVDGSSGNFHTDIFLTVPNRHTKVHIIMTNPNHHASINWISDV